MPSLLHQSENLNAQNNAYGTLEAIQSFVRMFLESSPALLKAFMMTR